MSEDQEREKFTKDEGDDVEAHRLSDAERLSEPDEKFETDDPDVEGHLLNPKMGKHET